MACRDSGTLPTPGELEEIARDERDPQKSEPIIVLEGIAVRVYDRVILPHTRTAKPSSTMIGSLF